MKNILTAFQFLTKLPIKIKGFQEEFLAESTVYFPLVGLFLGCLLVGLEYGLSPFLPPNIVALIQIAFLALITGGLHIDGFADTFDGLGCGKSEEGRLAVMKDSRIGTMGALAIVFLVLLKYNSLIMIGPKLKVYALLIFPIISRWVMVLIIFISGKKGHIGMGNRFQKSIRAKHFIISSILPFFLILLFFDSFGAITIFLVIFLVLAVYGLLLKTFGRITGDHFGFFNELVEVMVLLIFLIP